MDKDRIVLNALTGLFEVVGRDGRLSLGESIEACFLEALGVVAYVPGIKGEAKAVYGYEIEVFQSVLHDSKHTQVMPFVGVAEALSDLLEDRKLGQPLRLTTKVLEHRGYPLHYLIVNGDLGFEFGHNRLKWKYKDDDDLKHRMLGIDPPKKKTTVKSSTAPKNASGRTERLRQLTRGQNFHI